MTPLMYVAVAADPVPADNDVVGGPLLAILLGVLAVAVVLLVWSMSKQLKKTQKNADAGVFGDEPDDDSTPTDD